MNNNVRANPVVSCNVIAEVTVHDQRAASMVARCLKSKRKLIQSVERRGICSKCCGIHINHHAHVVTMMFVRGSGLGAPPFCLALRWRGGLSNWPNGPLPFSTEYMKVLKKRRSHSMEKRSMNNIQTRRFHHYVQVPSYLLPLITLSYMFGSSES